MFPTPLEKLKWIFDPIPDWLRLTEVQQRELFTLQVNMNAARNKIRLEMEKQLADLEQKMAKQAQEIIAQK